MINKRQNIRNKLGISDLHMWDYLKLILVASLGILGSVILFAVSRDREHAQIKSHFTQVANGRIAVIKRAIENNLFLLDSAARFYESSDHIRRDEFHSFVSPFLEHDPSLQSVEWIPRVRQHERRQFEQSFRQEGFNEFEIKERNDRGEYVCAGQRESYYPVFYMESVSGNERALGYDLGSELVRLQALCQARDSGQMTITDPFTLVRGTVGQNGFLIFRPVYARNVPLESVEDRRNHLEGFIVGVFQLECLIQESLSQLSDPGIHLSITSVSDKSGKPVIYYHCAPVRPNSSADCSMNDFSQKESFQYEETCQIADRQWNLSCGFTQDHVDEHWEVWGFLGMGLGITGLVTYFYGALLRRMLKNRRQTDILQYTMNQLQKAHANNTILVDAISAIFISLDNHDHVIQWNTAAEDIFGISATEAVGRALTDLAIPWNQKEIVQAIEECRTDNHTVKIDEVGFIQRNGQQGFLGLTISAIETDSGTGVGCILLGQDITIQKQEMEKIRELQQQIGFILGASKTRLDIIDADFTLRYVDEEWQKIYGPYEGRKCYAYFMDRDEACSGCGVDQALKTKQSIVTEEVLIKEGNQPVQVTTIPFEASNGEWLVAEVNVDIAERKRAEKMREQSLSRQKKINLLQQKLLGPDTLDQKLKLITNGVIDFMSADFCRIWVTASGDLCEKGCVHAAATEGPHACQNRDHCLHLISSSGRYTHIDGPGHRRVPFGAYKIGRIAVDLDRKFLTNDAPHDPRVHNHIWADELGLVSFAGYQLRPPGGETLGVLALFSKQPISPEDDAFLESFSNTVAQVIQLAQINEAMQETGEKYRSIFDTAANLIMTLDSNAQILECNRRSTSVLGYKPEELIGQSMDRVIFETDYPRFLQSIQNIPTQESLFNQEYRMVRKEPSENGSILEVSINFTLYADKHNNCSNIICIINDITEHKLLQSQLLQSQKLESIGQLAAGIAHEINTPTQYISDNIRFLEEGFSDIVSLLKECHALQDISTEREDKGKWISNFITKMAQTDLKYLMDEIPVAIRHSMEGIKSVADIVMAMKEFSHPGQKERKMLDVNKAIQNTVTITKNQWKYVADLYMYLEPNLPMVRCYPAEINQVFLNIISNAADAVSDTMDRNQDKKGMIVITSDRVQENWIELRISDTGKGIAPEHQDKIFNPFFTTKSVGKGTGQGLAISHSILRRHNGTITYETNPGEGTTFIIRLPLSEESL